MSLLHWFKENFELLTVGAAGIGGVGKIVHTQGEHEKKIDKLEVCHEQVRNDLAEIKGDIKQLLERTKHL
jgi:hypothetical protein